MSAKYTLNQADWKKIGKGAGIALAGAALTYASQEITQIDFGDWTGIVMAFWAVVVNAIRKLLADNSST